MKKKLFLLLGFVILLAIGISSCLADTPKINITAFATLTAEDAINKNLNPCTTFPKGSGIGAAITIETFDYPAIRYVVAFKQGERVLSSGDYTFSKEYSSQTIFIWDWPLNYEPGRYTMEVYVVDTYGNVSNIKKQLFTITE